MAKTEQISIRIAPNLKSQVEALFAQMGLTTSEAVTMFFTQVANRGEIPFTIKAKIPNAETLEAMEETERILKDPNRKTFNTVAELLEDLNS